MSGDHNMNQTDSGWRKRQIALDKKAENARELGLDYEPDKAKQNSGFALNPIGYTGFFCGGRNPATQDCFWRCRILEEEGEEYMVELEDGNKGWIPKKEFTPLAMREQA